MRLLIFETVAKNNRYIVKKEPFWLMCVPWCSTSFTPCLVKIELINLNSVKEKGVFSGLWPRIPVHHHPHSHLSLSMTSSGVFLPGPFQRWELWYSLVFESVCLSHSSAGSMRARSLLNWLTPFSLPAWPPTVLGIWAVIKYTLKEQATNYLNESMFLKVGN